MNATDQNVEDIRALLLERSRVGLREYGVPTDRAGLRLSEWAQHAIEELLDAAVYLRQMQREMDGKVGLQDYLRLCERHHAALDLIAKHEVTIANQAREIERLREGKA